MCLKKIKKSLLSFEEYSTLVLSFIINLAFYHKKTINDTPKRIIIVKLDHIGDVILSIPAIANIRHQFPQSKITMVVNPSSKAIAELIPYIDEIICYNAHFFDRSNSTKILDFKKAIRFALDMRKKNFDLIVDLRGSFASLLFALISKSKYRIDRGTYLIKRRLSRSKNYDKNKTAYSMKQKGDYYTLKHEAKISLDILSKAGINTEIEEIRIGHEIPSKDNMPLSIIIHPGGPMLQKRWSAERYIELIKQLLLKYDCYITIIGGKDESEIVNLIASAINDKRVFDLAGKLTISQLVDLLKKSSLFIGNDSGPMHIASACGTKVIGLFGPTDPERFGPYGKNCIALRMEKNCPPCSHGNCKFSNYRCIDQISVDNVLETINEIIY